MYVVLNIFYLCRCLCWFFRLRLRLGNSFVSSLSFNSNTLYISLTKLFCALLNNSDSSKFSWPINCINLMNNSSPIPLPIYFILKHSFHITLNHFTFMIGLYIHKFESILFLQKFCRSLPIKHIIEFLAKSTIRIFFYHV